MAQVQLFGTIEELNGIEFEEGASPENIAKDHFKIIADGTFVQPVSYNVREGKYFRFIYEMGDDRVASWSEFMQMHTAFQVAIPE